MMKLYLKILITIHTLYSCASQINSENKICTVAKITLGSVASKNGAMKFGYFYKGNLYLDIARFDARYFTYGDMFLIFIDKSNPKKYEILKPRQKVDDSRNFYKLDNINYYLDENDLTKLDSIE